MKKLMVLGAAGVLSLALGTTVSAADFAGRRVGSMAGHHIHHAVCTFMTGSSMRSVSGLVTQNNAAKSDPVVNNFAGYCGNYADADYDGVCDNYTDTDYNGVCDNYTDGNYDGVCDNYTDTDYNGVCDNYGNGGYQGYYNNNPGADGSGGYDQWQNGSGCGGAGNGYGGGHHHGRQGGRGHCW